jgi:ferrous-iron efflux pump FieF
MSRSTDPSTGTLATVSATRWITTASVATAAVLVALKVVVWNISGSVAVLASLGDSALDLMASIATFLAVRYAAAPPDAEHRFGHGKAEALASLLQAGLVFASAALILAESVDHLRHSRPLQQEYWAMAVMMVSILATFGLVTAQSWVLKSTRSVAISGDRAHYAADLISNLMALVAIGLTALTGLGLFDAIGGALVAILLLWGGIGVLRDAADQMLDRELPHDDRELIRKLVLQQGDVTDVHQLRTRTSGPFIHIQMHAELDPTLSLARAHSIMVAAENRILSKFPSADIIIHPDPKGMAEAHGGAFGESHQASIH